MDLKTIGFSIRRYFLDSGRFSPLSLLVTTWFKVRPYGNQSDAEVIINLIMANGTEYYANNFDCN